MSSRAKTIFEKVIDREIPSQIVYETEELIALKDINPQAAVHVLVVPKKHFNRLAEVPMEEAELLGKLLIAAAHVAKLSGLEKSGFRVVINNGRDGGETVPHLHVHVLGGRPMGWPPG